MNARDEAQQLLAEVKNETVRHLGMKSIVRMVRVLGFIGLIAFLIPGIYEALHPTIETTYFGADGSVVGREWKTEASDSSSGFSGSNFSGRGIGGIYYDNRGIATPYQTVSRVGNQETRMLDGIDCWFLHGGQ